jgi:hypothetical protein
MLIVCLYVYVRACVCLACMYVYMCLCCIVCFRAYMCVCVYMCCACVCCAYCVCCVVCVLCVLCVCCVCVVCVCVCCVSLSKFSTQKYFSCVLTHVLYIPNNTKIDAQTVSEVVNGLMSPNLQIQKQT